MFEGEYKVSLDKAGDELWIGRVEQDGIAVLAYVRKYQRQDGTESFFTPGIAGLEMSLEDFNDLLGERALALDEQFKSGQDILMGRNGTEYAVLDDRDAGIRMRAFASKKNPDNTTIAWEFTDGPLAGLKGFLVVCTGRSGRYVVTNVRQGVVSLRAFFVRNMRVAPIIKNEKTGKEKADMERVFWAPQVRTVSDAVGLWNNMMFQSVINDYANASAGEAPVDETEELETAEVPF